MREMRAGDKLLEETGRKGWDFVEISGGGYENPGACLSNLSHLGHC